MKKMNFYNYFRGYPEILKVLRIMKAIVLLMLIFVGQLFAKISAQDIKLDFQVNQKSLIEVMDLLKAKSGFSFIYSAKDVEQITGITVDFKGKTVPEILTDILKETDLTFEIDADLVILKKNKLQTQQSPKYRLVTGVVKDQCGEVLPGVTVVFKGTTMGTTTTKTGSYTLNIPTDMKEVTLVFSFIGKKDRTVKYTGQLPLNIVLEDDMHEMEEVVITGYQQIEKRHLTSAVTSIKAEDILLPQVATIDQMLESHVPGMIFMQNSGQVGAAPKLRIRGTSTVLGSQEPLWVVDGIIQTDPVDVDPSQINDLDFVNLLGNAISGLNPNDIEQIDVLKDASATALYGARAANGVIVITTKKGKTGPPSVSYSFAGSLKPRSRYTDKSIYVMNSRERIDYSREIIEKGLSYSNVSGWVGYEGALMDYWKGKIDFAEFQRQVNLYESVNTDWLGELCQDAFSHNHTLSISGGSETMKYYASVGYNRENGTLKKEFGERYTANIKLTINQKRFTGQFSLSGNVNEKEYTPNEIKLMDYAYNTSRAVPVYNPDGSLWYYNAGRGGDGYTVPFNILNDRDNSSRIIKGNSLTFSSMLGYALTDNLKAEVTFSYGITDTNEDIYLGEKTSYAGELRKENNGIHTDFSTILTVMPFGGELRTSSVKNKNYMFRGQLNYNKFLDENDKHLLTVSLGGELSSTQYTGLSQTHRCYLPDRGKLISPVDKLSEYPKFLEWLSTNPLARGVLKDQLTNMVSGYGTLSYSFDNRYIFNVNMRIDASNKFGDQANKKLLPIWSTSARWNVKEDILQNANWVDDLALRFSFGYQGNMLSTESPELIIKKGALNDFFGEYESTIYNFPNPNLRWEKTASLNGTVDFALFKNKLRGSVSYFYKKTTNAFLQKRVSIVNGTDQYVINQGTLENKGLELTLNFIPIDTRSSLGGNRKGFSWRIDPQLGSIVNKLLDKAISSNNKTLHDDYTYADYLNGTAQIVGRPLNSFYSYRFAGLDPNDGRPTYDKVDENLFDEYSRMSKEKVWTTVMGYSGCRVPYLQGGISNTFSYGNFILSCNLAYSIGSKVRLLRLYGNQLSNNRTVAPLPTENVRGEFIHRWQRPGDEKYTNIPGLLQNDAFMDTFEPWWKDEPYTFADNIWQMYNDTDIRVISGNYLKIQNISLRYSIPEKICKKMQLQSAYLSVSATNLYTWSHKALRGQDPTSQSGSADKINVPVRPSYAFSFNITF